MDPKSIVAMVTWSKAKNTHTHEMEASPVITSVFFFILTSALLLSALKTQRIPYTPATIKRTVENTATTLGSHDSFSIGHGIVQVT